MLKYFDDFVGKDLGADVFAKLLFYFSINMSPVALPLGILIASLMTYGKLGEHFELTAIKAAGISLVRTLYPTFILVFFISIGAYFLSNNLVPWANLRAYSLLYDIKHKKPSIDLREGQFYTGIPNISMKVNKKFDEGEGLLGLIMYDHKNVNGNKKVIVADSARMYTFINDRYLMLELYSGNHYLEKKGRKKDRKNKIEQFTRTDFKSMKIVYSLASFDLADTDKGLFAGNRKMKSVEQIQLSLDSMQLTSLGIKTRLFGHITTFYSAHLSHGLDIPEELLVSHNYLQRKKDEKDSLIDLIKQQRALEIKVDSVLMENEEGKLNSNDSLNNKGAEKNIVSRGRRSYGSSPVEYVKPVIGIEDKEDVADKTYIVDSLIIKKLLFDIDNFFKKKSSANSYFSSAIGVARNIKSNLSSSSSRVDSLKDEINAHATEKYKKYAIAFSCMVLFLIGAPLGAIIKKGGLGVPVIIAIFFFIVFYVMMIISEKWAKSGSMDPLLAAWLANIFLAPFGIFFLRQARLDARVFDVDVYLIWFDNIKAWIDKKRESQINK